MNNDSNIIDNDILNTPINNNTINSIEDVRSFISEVLSLSEKYNMNCFIVSDGASGYRNYGNSAVKNARDCQIQWEKENGFDPNHDWRNE